MNLRLAVPPLLWAALIFAVSSIPNPPGTGGSEVRSQLAHVGEYTIFAALLFITIRQFAPDWSWFSVAALAWAIAVLYGFSDEWHQSFVRNRDSSLLDVGMDAIGATIGTSAMLLASRVVPGLASPRSPS